MQIIAALLLVYSEVILNDFGYLLSDKLFENGVLAVPLTVFATVGVINSLNMIDGIDGLAGLVSVVILSLLLFVSILSETAIQSLIIVCMLGSVSGFLIFNMRRPGFKKAKVFMGDAGSTLLGFIFAYLLISLSQVEERAISPVTGLWLFALPLMDTLGVMSRRIWLKKSPFSADRCHLHHLLIDAGFRVRHAVYMIAFLQLLLGIAGIMFYYQNIPDSISFMYFLLIFVVYTYLISSPWRAIQKLRTMHRAVDITVKGTYQVYVGGINEHDPNRQVELLLGDYKYNCQYDVYECKQSSFVFAVIDANDTDNVKQLMRSIKKSSKAILNKKICIRQYIIRNIENDRRKAESFTRYDYRRLHDRRAENCVRI
jgi:undecaprenyl-phosphate alpha-N-acetylglucosaminyl 1-phosphatetransferase